MGKGQGENRGGGRGMKRRKKESYASKINLQLKVSQMKA